MNQPFDYHRAFMRTVGWVTERELKTLRRTTVAIAGLGGVGGSHLLTLARLGVGRFRIADPDRFELHNMNRQAGAFASTLGRRKTEVLARMALDINPGLSVDGFDTAIDSENVTDFLDGADVYVDGLDYFVFEARRNVFAACRRQGIPAVTAAPLGMGAALLTFAPDGITFDDYFQLAGESPEEQALRFMLGLAPAGLQMGYLVDPSRVDLAGQSGPSTPMACELCAGMAATEVLKIVLKRGPVRTAPRGLHFDAYRGRLARTWRPGGNRNPLQRLLLSIARRRLVRHRS